MHGSGRNGGDEVVAEVDGLNAVHDAHVNGKCLKVLLLQYNTSADEPLLDFAQVHVQSVTI